MLRRRRPAWRYKIGWRNRQTTGQLRKFVFGSRNYAAVIQPHQVNLHRLLSRKLE